MNNQQLILWIHQHHHIYLTSPLTHYLAPTAHPLPLTPLLTKVTQRSFQVMETHLRDNKAVYLQDFMVFYPAKPKNTQTNNPPTLNCAPIGKIKSKILSTILRQSPLKTTKRLQHDELCKQVGSLLWVPEEIVKQLLRIYSRAAGDLISSGKALDLNLGFCKLKLTKSQLDCRFSLNILKYISEHQQESNKQNHQNQVWLWDQVGGIGKVSEDERWHKNWEQIKQGNLFDYPSLREIKNHLEVGYKLELKYKKIYD